ncbi:hypothetical protein SAMN02745244_03313 [Tessaracoccus bendigoensis DSM 12906]|uniref:Uncharacterized protein n=1 Tax=Tessaracoccus bendigoensis DSM 12906 TaxID=1123357 RepID=A0A1M6MC54_9ACTN|nr:hypothetical protein [Tessaracoccus bendigoensis]SHJ80843.1 hypothetical protein SAMN02745244_03313 [Tessaracoccus bendigoensis DSM 12906]
MNTVRQYVDHRVQQNVIVIPELARLNWRDRMALRFAIWAIEHTVRRSESYSEHTIRQHTDAEIARREQASMHWLPPR